MPKGRGGKMPRIALLGLAFMLTACISSFSGRTTESDPPASPEPRHEQTETQEPQDIEEEQVERYVREGLEGEELEARDPDIMLVTVSALLVGASLDLSQASHEAGLDQDYDWNRALNRWFGHVDHWMSTADSTIFENFHRGPGRLNDRRLSMLLESERRLRDLRNDLLGLLQAFRQVQLGPEIISESMPGVEAALGRAGQAVHNASSIIEMITDNLSER
jgi:hypothetical protein